MSNKIILNELKKHNLNLKNIKDLKEMRIKDGIYLYRFTYKELKCVIKYFKNEAYRREIFYYLLFKELNIPTINLYYINESSIILEDINESKHYRLGQKEDLGHPKVAKGLIKWYQTFHKKSTLYLNENKALLKELYSEYDCVTKDVVIDVLNKSNVLHHEYWQLFLKEFNRIKSLIEKHTVCLTYNDFYYTNFIVSKDFEEVIMYDYNFIGKGFIYSDIRNVSASLKGEAKETFLNHYTKYEPIEKAIDEIFSPIFTLYEAYKRDVFPNWANDELRKIKSGELKPFINQLTK